MAANKGWWRVWDNVWCHICVLFIGVMHGLWSHSNFVYAMHYYITSTEMVESNLYVLVGSEQESDSSKSAEEK